MADIELRNVSLQYGDHPVLSNVSLGVQEGEFLTLLGPSGCGKSTTLNIVAGLLEPTSGDVLIGGKSMLGAAPRDRKVAMVFQDYALYPHMSVYENLAFPLRAVHMPESSIRSKVTQVADALAIAALLERTPKALSGGQRQRVALGRALVREPGAFLMDEPLSNLDARLRVAMRAELKALHQRLRTTTVYVTHDQSEAMTLSGRIAVLRDGLLLQVGTPRDIYERPVNEFVASFVGALGMNFVPCTLERASGDFALSRGEFRVSVQPTVGDKLARTGTEFMVGLRPEHVMIDGSAHPHCRARVEVVEYLGSETLVHVDIGDSRLIGKAPAGVTIKPGDLVPAHFAHRSACIFDQNGTRLVATGTDTL